MFWFYKWLLSLLSTGSHPRQWALNTSGDTSWEALPPRVSTAQSTCHWMPLSETQTKTFFAVACINLLLSASLMVRTMDVISTCGVWVGAICHSEIFFLSVVGRQSTLMGDRTVYLSSSQETCWSKHSSLTPVSFLELSAQCSSPVGHWLASILHSHYKAPSFWGRVILCLLMPAIQWWWWIGGWGRGAVLGFASVIRGLPLDWSVCFLNLPRPGLNPNNCMSRETPAVLIPQALVQILPSDQSWEILQALVLKKKSSSN